MTQDIISETDRHDWLVIGWFTPDYRGLAKKFATNLDKYNVPYHLFAKSSVGEWNTARKPTIVLEAMKVYPGAILVLMDVDCAVNANIEPLVRMGGDVGITVLARNVVTRSKIRHYLHVECSSRVVVFDTTAKSEIFALRWARQIRKSSVAHDEHSMAWAFIHSPDINFKYIDQRYSGREVGTLPGAIITHDSAHEKIKGKGKGNMFQWLEKKLFRTGKTKRDKLKAEIQED